MKELYEKPVIYTDDVGIAFTQGCCSEEQVPVGEIIPWDATFCYQQGCSMQGSPYTATH